VRMVYDPPSFATGWLIAALCVLACLALGLFRYFSATEASVRRRLWA
jgi:hypothetical protein